MTREEQIVEALKVGLSLDATLEAIARQIAALYEQEGWKLVPEEPTEAMCTAYLDAEDKSPMIDPLGAFEDGYAAMLAIAPQPTGGEE